MSIDYRVLLLAGLTILLRGTWGFFGKVALEKNMAPRSVFLAEVFHQRRVCSGRRVDPLVQEATSLGASRNLRHRQRAKDHVRGRGGVRRTRSKYLCQAWYSIVDVPCDTVVARARFILDTLGLIGDGRVAGMAG